MRNTIFRVIYAVLLFGVAVVVMELLLNHESVNSTAEMREAVFPVITMQTQGQTVNELHGFKTERSLQRYRGPVTPLGTDRKVSFTIDTFGQTPESLSFEVRALEDGRLIEDGELTDLTTSGQESKGSFTIHDLIENDKEYMLIFLVKIPGEENTLRYYTRIIASEDNAAREKMSFVLSFHNATFSKTAASSITTYIEPNSEGDNSSYAHVDIHSSYGQITWGDLEPEQVGEADISVEDMQTETAIFRVDYLVRAKSTEGNSILLRCQEYFRIRKGESRINLLDYERYAEQVYVPSGSVQTDGVVTLGITGEDSVCAESDGGSAFAFVQAGKLYACNPVDNAIAYVYGFGDFDSQDAREIWNRYEIKILNVDETGNVDFLVYGYMNRGDHEGELGAAVYNYNSIYRTVEEKAFVPYDGSAALLKAQIERLSYLNKSNSLFLMMNETIYEIDLASRQVSEIAAGLTEDSYQVSSDGRMIAWKQTDGQGTEQIVLEDLSDKTTQTIDAAAGEHVNPLGFIGEDLIYGKGRKSDVVADPTGSEVQPMYCVQIINSSLEVLENYQITGYYVTGCEVNGNQIILHRLKTQEADSGVAEMTEEIITAAVAEEEDTEDAPEEQTAKNSEEATDASPENSDTGDVSTAQTGADTAETGDADTGEDGKAPLTVLPAESSRFETALDDQIMDAQEETTGSHQIQRVSSEEWMLVSQVSAKGMKAGSFKYVRPKEALFEGDREVALTGEETAEELYVVYDLYGVAGVYQKASQAVQKADDVSGFVTDEKGLYIWKKGNRNSVNQIMSITARSMQEGETSLSVCLQTILDFEGKSGVNAAALLSQGKTLQEVLTENIDGARVMDLTGASLDAVLYYVGTEKPVLAARNNGQESVLIVGYNESQVVLMDPAAGTLYKITRTNAESLFGQSGNGYVAYVVQD